MEVFVQQVFNGIMLGSIYAVVAAGLTLVFGILHIPNFAHGHFYMIGAYVTFFLITSCKFGFWPALLLSGALLALLGVLVERVAFRPMRNHPRVNAFISAIGVLMFLEAFVTAVWGPEGRRIPNPYPDTVKFLGVVTTQQRLLVIATTIVLIVLLYLFIKKTFIGATIEAVAQNREGAMLVGINVNHVSSITFAISAATAAIAASVVAPIFMISPTMGALVGMKAFIVVILGGLGNIPGAIVGGYILGIIEALGGGYISADYKDVFAFGVLILTLAIKPTGLFGKELD